MKDPLERSMYLINKESKIFGFKMMELIMVLSTNLMIAMLVSAFTLILTMPLTYLLYKEMSQAEKKGCPDFIDSVIGSSASPKHIEDSESIFSKL
jgi:hypothetical protein